MVEHGFYILKDSFFELIKDPYLKNNKDGKRPFFYCLRDLQNNKEMYWLIPLSSQIDKYRTLIAQKEHNNKPTDGLYICSLPNGKESVFLIQEMFPVTGMYIDREYELNGQPLVLVAEKDIKAIETKASHTKRLILKGIHYTPTSPNVLDIIKKLSL